jgi:5-methylcytosine-specific restriction endonuclease McrA
METNNKQCLLLNADFTPLSVISWKKAILWSLKQERSKYRVEIIDFYKNDYINGVNKKYPIPAVARLSTYVKINYHTINFCRKNIFIRDNYTCQYCGTKKEESNLTYDHVVPKSKWRNSMSPTNWTNIVTSCRDCNRKKGNKTPQEARMGLLNLPIQPQKNFKYLHVYEYLLRINRNIPSEWTVYLPQSYIY